MAKTINCDAPGCDQVAGFLLTILDSGTARGLCQAHWLELCAAAVMGAAGQELDAESAAAVAALAPASEGIDLALLAGELWTCGGCGFEAASEEALTEHVIAEHSPPPIDDPDEQIVSRETIESPA